MPNSLGGSMPHFEIGRLDGRYQILHEWSEDWNKTTNENETKTILWMKVCITSSFFRKRATHCSYSVFSFIKRYIAFHFEWKKNHLITGIWSCGAPIRSAYTHLNIMYTFGYYVVSLNLEKSKNIFDASFQIYLWSILFVFNYKVCIHI